MMSQYSLIAALASEIRPNIRMLTLEAIAFERSWPISALREGPLRVGSGLSKQKLSAKTIGDSVLFFDSFQHCSCASYSKSIHHLLKIHPC